MAREVNVADAADWTDEEAAVNLAYLDTRGRIDELQRALKARETSWEEYSAVPEPETFPQPEGGDRGNQGSASAHPVVSEAEAVPSGTIDDVLDWVDEDRTKAAKALAAEQAGKNRSGLVEALEDILAEEDV